VKVENRPVEIGDINTLHYNGLFFVKGTCDRHTDDHTELWAYIFILRAKKCVLHTDYQHLELKDFMFVELDISEPHWVEQPDRNLLIFASADTFKKASFAWAYPELKRRFPKNVNF
jgi:hypothetical protein